VGEEAVDLFRTYVSLDSVESVRAELESRGVTPVSISTYALDGPGSGEQVVASILETLRVADELGSWFVTTTLTTDTRRSTDEQIEDYKRVIGPCLDEAERLGITLLLENRWDWFRDDPGRAEVTRRAEWFAQLMERVASPRFRVAFDPANFAVVGEEPYPHAYEMLKDVIGYVHVKDVSRYHEKRHGLRKGAAGYELAPPVEAVIETGPTNVTNRGIHVWADGEVGGSDPEFVFTSVGEGVVNWHGLLGALRRDGYTGWFLVEPHILPFYGERHERAAQQAVKYLRQSQ